MPMRRTYPFGCFSSTPGLGVEPRLLKSTGCVSGDRHSCFKSDKIVFSFIRFHMKGKSKESLLQGLGK